MDDIKKIKSDLDRLNRIAVKLEKEMEKKTKAMVGGSYEHARLAKKLSR